MNEKNTQFNEFRERVESSDGFQTYLFSAEMPSDAKTLWMITPYPGPTAMYLEEIPFLRKAGYSVYLSVENPESEAMVRRKFGNIESIHPETILPMPDIMMLSAVESENFSISMISAYKDMNPDGYVVFQEDTPGSMRPVIEYMVRSDTRFVPDIILTPTHMKAEEYKKLFRGKDVFIAPVGNPDLDRLPHDLKLTQQDVSELRDALGISDDAIVIYLVGKAAQYMELPDYIHLPEHQDLSGVLTGRRDVNSFFLYFSMQAVEYFRSFYAKEIGSREVIVLHRPHPRDRENVQGKVHAFGAWFANAYPHSDVRIINKTTEQWNAILEPDSMFYISDIALFFDSTLINRVVLDIVAQYKKFHKPYEEQAPRIAFPLIYHPWAALCVPYFTRRVDHERIFVTAFTRYWQELATTFFPSVVFNRKYTEQYNLPFMNALAAQNMLTDTTGNWMGKTSSDMVVGALQTYFAGM